MFFYKIIFLNFLSIIALVSHIDCTHIQGTFHSNEFFKFLIKFGFQKTDKHHPEETHGYIFGNITSRHNFSVPITFAVLDRFNFLEFYGSRNVVNKSEACKLMFQKLNSTSYDSKCNPTGKDFLRHIPCEKGDLCVDEDTPNSVIKNSQFTYHIQNEKQPK